MTKPKMTLPTVMLAGITMLAALLVPSTAASGQTDGITLTPMGAYETGLDGGAEIVAFTPTRDRAYVTNGANNAIDIISFADPESPELLRSISLDEYGAGIQSVAVRKKLVAAAVKADDGTANGNVVVAKLNGKIQDVYEVGVLPDAIAFTPNGRYIVVANEAEPVCADEELLEDPPGTVSIIDTKAGTVATADFTAWNGKEDELRDAGIRIFGPGGSASRDIEPEYVAIGKTGATAYITLQENNAVAVVDIAAAEVVAIVPLGYKDHSLQGNGIDPSNEDGSEAIASWDVLGMYMPDAIASYRARGTEYLVTANEGDARDYDCYSEEVRVGDFASGEGIAEGLGDTYAADAIEEANLGRLKTTTAFPTVIGDDGKVEQVYSYGARSFTIWNPETGDVIYDSGDELAQMLVGTPYFNADDGETDGRSDDKGVEPEALTIGKVNGKKYAFVGLERAGGIAVYDITKPAKSTFVTYVNTNDMGDISPEGISFIPTRKSPTGNAMIIVSFEVSGSTRAFEID